MSSENTSIQITKAQKAELDELKKVDAESYKSVIGRLIDSDNEPQEAIDHPQMDTEEIVNQIKNDLSMVADPAVPEEELVKDIAERVETMEDTVKIQTQTIQSLQKTLEDMR